LNFIHQFFLFPYLVLGLEIYCTQITHLGIELGFIYDSDKKFEEGIRKIAGAGGDPKYLRFVCGMVAEARGTWLEKLVKIRNDIEHEGFCLPQLHCDLSSGTPKLDVYKVRFKDGSTQDLREAVSNFWNNLFHFVELLLIFLLVTRLPKGMALMMIPPRRRDPSCPIAFKVVPEPKTDAEGAETWEQFKAEAQAAHKTDKPPSASIRITDVDGKQLALWEFFPKEKGGTILSVDGLPLEVFLLLLRGKADALKVKGRPGVYQIVQIDDLSEEEFTSWVDQIAAVSSSSMIGHLVKEQES